jgi:hypothetical protein
MQADTTPFGGEADDYAGAADSSPARPWGWVFLAVTLAILGGLGIAGWAAGSDFPDVWNANAGGGPVPLTDLENLTNPVVHEHADFAIFLHGERLNFDDERYFSDGEHQHAPDVHIHPNRPNVVHKHRQNVNWARFFGSLGIVLEDERFVDADGREYRNGPAGTLKFFINGVQVDSLMHERISDLDRVLITFGAESEAELAAQLAAVGDEACIPSEKCDDRIPADEPDEPCSVTGPGASACF